MPDELAVPVDDRGTEREEKDMAGGRLPICEMVRTSERRVNAGLTERHGDGASQAAVARAPAIVQHHRLSSLQ